MFAPLLATYTVAAYRPRRISLPIMGLIVVGSVFAIWGGDGSDAADVAVGYFAGITAWVVGDSTRTQREHAALMATRRVEETQRAATQERLAIARDLHDIVAHNVSVIAVQAEAAQAVLASDPARAGQAMESVADTARGALVELRRLLGVLRSEHDFAPQPGLESIDDLVETVRRAGMDVRLSRSVVRPVGAVAGLTAYRVVQEALTNVLKHAGPCATDVALSVCRRRVDRVRRRRRCRSACRQRRPRVGRHAERVSVLGGTLDAGAGRRAGSPVRGAAAVVGMTIRVVVVDDQELVRSGLRMILDAQDDIEVVGEADDGDRKPWTAPGRCVPTWCSWTCACRGWTASTRRAALAGPGVAEPMKVVILTTFDLDEYVFEALRAGARGFLLKDLRREDLAARGASRRGGRGAAGAVDHEALDRGLRGRVRPARQRPTSPC